MSYIIGKLTVHVANLLILTSYNVHTEQAPTNHEFFVDDHFADNGVDDVLVQLKHVGQNVETE